jgi:hypothetical protein
MAKVERANKLMSVIQSKSGMTDAGKEWIIAVCDPAHDEKLLCSGYPDRETAPSVVQVIKQTLAVSKPTGFGATDKWGFHVRVDPALYNGRAYQSSDGNCRIYSYKNLVLQDSSGGYPTRKMGYGGLNVVYFDQTVNGTTDVTTSPVTEATTSNKLVQMQISPQNFGAGKSRVIAQAFEVVNTSTDLYKGGALLVYEQPSSRDDPYTAYLSISTLNPGVELFMKLGDPLDFDSDEKSYSDCDLQLIPLKDILKSGKIREMGKMTPYVKGRKGYRLAMDEDLLPNLNSSGAGSIRRDVMPPMSLAEALILPGSQQWDAKEGCYCVQTMDNMSNPATFCTPTGTMFAINELTYPLPGYEASPTTSPALSFYITQLQTAGSIASTGNSNVLFAENQPIPFNTKGAIITGQVPEATFTINYITIIERIISSQDQTLATLAKPSPPEDYVAIALYSEMCQRMPIGCKFKDNGLGDWFLGVVDEIANVVSTVGKPVLQAVDSYQNTRSGANPTGASYGPPKIAPSKVAGQTKTKKSGVAQTTAGPRLPSGNFKSPQAKAIKKEKKKIKRDQRVLTNLQKK